MNDKRLKRRGTKNGKPVWSARVPLPRSANGKRRSHRFTFVGTQKNAEKAFIDVLSKIRGNSFVAPERTTFGQYLAEFIRNSQNIYAPKTWERFEGIAPVHVIPKLGDVLLQRLDTSHLTKAYAEWLESGLSDQTVVHHHRLIHRVLAVAQRENHVAKNVAAIIEKKPTAVRAEMRFLSEDDRSRIFAVANGTTFSALIALALATGARRGELLGLKWGDIDLAGGRLSIRRSLEQTKKGVAEKPPKNGKSRVIELTAKAIETLRRYRLAQADAHGIGRISAKGYVFAGEDGAAWRPQQVTDRFRAIARKAGIVSPPLRQRATTRAGRRKSASPLKTRPPRRPAEITFHSLRHTFASLLLAQGVHPKIVQEMLGHSSIKITMDLYSHATPTLQSGAVQKLDAILHLPDADYATA
jgi:integrase